MSLSFKHILPTLLIAAAGTSIGTPADAGTGCNGVVAWWVWGCAPWDNNNGSQFPFYKKQAVAVPAGKTIRVDIKGNDALAVIDGKQMPIIGGKAALVASGGGNLVASGGGNLVASGGGNLKVWSGQ